MPKPLRTSEEVLKIFQELKSNDPKIKINDTSIAKIPKYGNYVFVLNFIPAIVGIYVLINRRLIIVSYIKYITVTIDSEATVFLFDVPYSNW